MSSVSRAMSDMDREVMRLVARKVRGRLAENEKTQTDAAIVLGLACDTPTALDADAHARVGLCSMRKVTTRDGTTADAVRAELARARKTQTDAATVLDLSVASMSRRLAGSVEFTVAEVRTLADWLGVPMSVLIGETAGAA